MGALMLLPVVLRNVKMTFVLFYLVYKLKEGLYLTSLMLETFVCRTTNNTRDISSTNLSLALYLYEE